MADEVKCFIGLGKEGILRSCQAAAEIERKAKRSGGRGIEDYSLEIPQRQALSKTMKSSKESVKRAGKKNRDEERLLPQLLAYHRQRR